MLYHCNNDCTNVPQRYVTRTLPVSLCMNIVKDEQIWYHKMEDSEGWQFNV